MFKMISTCENVVRYYYEWLALSYFMKHCDDVCFMITASWRGWQLLCHESKKSKDTPFLSITLRNINRSFSAARIGTRFATKRPLWPLQPHLKHR